MGKTHTIILRGIEKAKKNSLKRFAKNKRTSVNSILLQMIDDKTEKEIEVFEIKKKSNGKENKR